MSKIFAGLLFLACFLAATSSSAHLQGRAYAPENLGQLSVSDQVRVIENEYRDQSGGRRIADDQLDFYLDQVRYSRWTFSRIQADMSQSLRGSAGNWGPPSSGWDRQEVTCTSDSRRYRECRTPFRGPARITQQISSTRCVEGSNWGSRPGLIWVDEGCRARFAEDRRGWPTWGGGGGQREIECASNDDRYRQCNTGFRGRARISKQLSRDACIEGRSWGQGPGMVWVSRGCRARFEDTGWSGANPGQGGSGYSITCASSGGDRRTCAWNDRYGRPFLIERLSQASCVEGRSWGFNRGSVWVDDGCRARFGAR